MYSKAAILALVAPLACATIVLQQPTKVASSSAVTLSWTSNDPANDPTTFSIELVNTNFHDTFAVANNVQTSAGSITVTLPVIPPGDGYQVEFVNIGNVNDVFAISGDFAVAPAPSTSGASVPATSSHTGTGSVTGIVPTTSAFGTTVGSSATTPTSGSSATLSVSQSSSSSTATSTKFNGAVSHSSNSYAALVLSAFAGVALLAL